MNLTTILQMQKDRSNGVVLSQPSIDKLIGHALMREIESERLTQALADSNLALMQAQEVAQAQAPVAAIQPNPHAATFPAEIWLNVGDGDAHEVGPYKDLSELSWCWESIDRYDVRYVRADLAAPQPSAAPVAAAVQGEALAALHEHMQNKGYYRTGDTLPLFKQVVRALTQRTASQPDTVPTTVANQAINDALRLVSKDSERDAARWRAYRVSAAAAMSGLHSEALDTAVDKLVAAMAAQQSEKR